MKTIAWLPENLNANRSFFKFKQSTELAGFKNLSEREFYSNLKGTDYLILNFYEDIQKKFGFYFIAFLGRYIRLMRFKKNGIKIVWFINNKVPHDDNAKWAIRMMKVLVKHSFKLIGLCSETAEVLKVLCPKEEVWKDKLVIMPHPNYIGAYKTEEIDFTPDKFTALFFGAVRPYKNVDTLIKAFKELPQDKVRLVVAGNAKNPDYKKYIEDLAKDVPSVELNLKYIDDDEIMELIHKSSVVVLPYDKVTTLNSGSVLLSCTAKKTFICPEIGTTKDFKDKSLFYSYSYDNENEHSEKLFDTILKVYKDYENNTVSFGEKGQKLFEYVQKEHGVECLSMKWSYIL